MSNRYFCFPVKVFSVQHKFNFSASFPCHGKFEQLLSPHKLIFRVNPISELNHLKISYLFAKFHACITKRTILTIFGLSSWTTTEFLKIRPFLFNLVKLLHQSRNIQKNNTASVEISYYDLYLNIHRS